MREIKFRAWDGQDTMIYFDFNSIKHDGLIDWNENKYSDTGGGLYIDNCDVMQYIGLQDKTGRNIYEGDILKWSDWRPNFYEYEHLYKYSNKVVNWSKKYGSWILDEKEELNLGIYSNVEIIGNIYENPELLDNN